MALCQGWGLRWEHFSAFPTCLDVRIFSFTQDMEVTQVSFWLLLAICSCTFGASMGGGKFRNLVCHHPGSSQRESNSTYPIEWFREYKYFAHVKCTAHCLAEFCMRHTHIHTDMCRHAFAHTSTSSFYDYYLSSLLESYFLRLMFKYTTFHLLV